MGLNKSEVLDKFTFAQSLENGSVGFFPTDTVPALAALPKQAYQLWKIKRRSIEKPLILMGSKPEQLFPFVDSIALEDAWQMAKSYWPGALTLVLPASGKYLELLNPQGKNLGIRVPANLPARDLLDITGPLATTSANISGSESLLTSEEISKCFPGIPLLGPIPWRQSLALPSTVLVWQDKSKWKVVREGSLNLQLP